MNIQRNLFIATLLFFGTLFLSSCLGDDDPEKEQPGKYVVGLRATDGDASADYVLAVDDLMTDTITSTGNGIEQSGWSYYTFAGNKFFSVGYTLNECIAYTVTGGVLELDSKFIFERIDCMNALDTDNFMGIGAPWGGGSYDCQLQVINVKDVAIDRTVNHPIYESYYYVDSLEEHVQLNAWPTHSYLDGDNLYVSFYPLHGTSWQTPLMDTAYVSIFSYPELAYIKTIKDNRTGPIGYYGSQPSIITTDDGDHYTISSSSYMAGFTKVSKPSGLLRINSGADEFDPNYFFDVESTYGYKILTATYVGNGKAVARVIDTSIETGPEVQWAAFGNYAVFEIAVLDLEAKTLAMVDDVPIHHGQYQTPFFKEDGKVYMSIRSEEGTFIYQIDANTATAVRGSKIDGIELQAIARITE